jgi:hypothetical protein
MKKYILFGIILSCFLFIITPNINALQLNEAKQEMQNRIQEQKLLLEKFNKNVLAINFKNFFQIVLSILYIIGYVVCYIHVFIEDISHPYGMPLGILWYFINSALTSFFWPAYFLLIYLDNFVQEGQIEPGNFLYLIYEMLFAFFYYIIGFSALALSFLPYYIIAILKAIFQFDFRKMYQTDFQQYC